MGNVKYQLSRKEKENRRNKLKTPFEKLDDIPAVEDIIKNDAMLVRVAFISSLMVRNMTSQQMREKYTEHFGEEVSQYKITQLRRAARLVYLSQISTNRDEQIAEELMRAEWESNELMNAWDDSKKGGLKKTHHKAKSDGTELTTYDLDEDTEETTRSFGDIRYMEQLGKVRQRVISMLGLEAPKQPVQQQNNTVPTVTINVVDRKQPTVNIEEAQVVNE